jgi:catalase
VHSYNKDGAMTYRHAGDQPVYAPNSYGGPQADPRKELPSWWVEAGEIGRYAYEPTPTTTTSSSRGRSTATC